MYGCVAAVAGVEACSRCVKACRDKAGVCKVMKDMAGVCVCHHIFNRFFVKMM